MAPAARRTRRRRSSGRAGPPRSPRPGRPWSVRASRCWPSALDPSIEAEPVATTHEEIHGDNGEGVEQREGRDQMQVRLPTLVVEGVHCLLYTSDAADDLLCV